MQYKVTAKDIKQLQKWGQEDDIVKVLIHNQVQPQLFYTGYYTPSNANWSWHIGIVRIGGGYYELLTRFGSVEGGRYIPILEYSSNILRGES